MCRHFLLLIFLLALGGNAFSQSTPPAPDQSLDSLPTEDLIAKLQEESNQGIGTHATAWASGFLAIDDEPRFRGGILGSKKPAASPVMRELVRRGLAALPMLIAHLTDARPTKLTVGDGFMGKWFSDEYDPRYSDPKPKQLEMNTEREFDHYTLAVGDLCFVAIGQIVNRQLNAVRYQPTACLVVNSPLKSPALAAAVKADWSGLTPQDHRRSLEQDAINPLHPNGSGDALKRLSFYYPQVGDALIIKMLNRPFYEQRLTYDFFDKVLANAKSDEEWDSLVADFRTKHGEANYIGVLECLIGASNFPESQMSPDHRKSKDVADRLLHHLFPGFDPRNPTFLDAVGVSEQQTLVEDLAALHSSSLDETISQVLQRLASMPAGHNSDDRFAQGSLASACAQRLIGQEKYQAACRSSLEKLVSGIQEARKIQGNAVGDAGLDSEVTMLRELLKKSNQEAAK